MNHFIRRLHYLFLVAIILLCFPSFTIADPVYLCAHKTNGKLRLLGEAGLCDMTEIEHVLDDGDGVQAQIDALKKRVVIIEDAVGIINVPPVVTVGPNQDVFLSDGAFLDADASDDGLLLPLEFSWSKNSGPGEVLFDSPQSEDSQVNFDLLGEYSLRLNVTDGLVSVYDDVIINVFPDNTPPIVSAGPNQTLTGWYEVGASSIELVCDTELSGEVSDDGLPEPLTISWEESAGVYFDNINILNTGVEVRGGGGGFWPNDFTAYVSLTASDGFHTVTDTMTIHCDLP